MIAVRLEQITVRYGASRVMHEVTAEAPAGSLIGLCGPNGAGKSTLLRLMLGLRRPDRGRVRVLGFDPCRHPGVRRQIGYLPQVPRLDPGFPLSVRDLVELGNLRSLGTWAALDHLWSAARRQSRRQVDIALEMTGLTALAQQPVSQLSGGQLQLALLARAMVGGPRLLLLDEPLAGLDQTRQAEFYPCLEQWRSLFGVTAIVVCHELQALSAHVDALWCLDGSMHCHQLRSQEDPIQSPPVPVTCLIDGIISATSRSS